MNHYISALVVCLCLTACATIESTTKRDNFGIMAIDIPSRWHDDTINYHSEAGRVLEYRRKELDSGIKQLVALKSNDGVGFCKFRELKYVANEAGYHWGMERLAYEVALVRNRILEKNGVIDYLKLGVPVNPSQKKARRTMLVSSSEIRLGPYDAWQMTNKHWFENDDNVALTMTIVLRSMESVIGSTVKFYVVAECDAEGKEKKIEATRTEIDALLNTIRLGRDIGKSEGNRPQ